jgi:hypothetical protein
METPAGLRIGRSRPFGDRPPILVGGSPSIGDLDRVPPNVTKYVVYCLLPPHSPPWHFNTLYYTLIRVPHSTTTRRYFYFHLFHVTMSRTLDEHIDPALRASGSPIIPPRPTTSPAVLPDGTLTPKQDFEAHLYVHPCLASRPHSFNRRLYNSDAFAGKRSNTKAHSRKPASSSASHSRRKRPSPAFERSSSIIGE